MGEIVLSYVFLGAVAAAFALLILELLPPAWRRPFFVLAVFITVTPYLLHARWTIRWIANWGLPAGQAVGYFPALYVFLTTAWLSAGALCVAAFFLSRRLPELAAAVPVVMAALYWKWLLAGVYRSAPGVVWDNKALVALFIYTWIAASILLLLAGRLRVLARGSSHS